MSGKGLKIATGKVFKNKEFWYNPDAKDIDNPHTLIVGASGSGKTTLLRSIIKYLRYEGKTVFVLDFHGDLYVDGENTIRFTPRNSPSGINPFELELDEDKGGPKVQAEVVAQMFATYFMDKASIKQKSILERLIYDLYLAKGIDDSDPETWKKTPPDMNDFDELCRVIQSVVLQDTAVVGQGSASIACVIEYAKKLSSRKVADPDKARKIKEAVSLINKAVDTLGDIADDKESVLSMSAFDLYEKKYPMIDLSFYASSARSLDAIFTYIFGVTKMSIFNNNKPVLKSGVNRFDFSAITAVDKPLVAKFLSEIIAQKLFRSSAIRGEYKNLKDKKPGSKFDRMLVIDESRLVMPHGKEKDNPYQIMNRIVLEARKFGLGLTIASQRLNHYTEEMLSTMFTKIILKMKPYDYKNISKSLGIPVEQIADAFGSENSEYPAIIESSGSNKITYKMEKLDG